MANGAPLLATAAAIREGRNVVPTGEQPSTFEKFFGRGTLSERIERGLEVASPEFRQIRQQQRAFGLEEETVRKEEERAEQEFQQENRFIAFDDALGTTTPSQRKFIEDRARRSGIVIEEEGREGIRFGEGAKALQELQDEPEEIIALNNLGISDHRKSLASLKELEKKEIDKIVNGAIKENPSGSPMETKERIAKALRDPANQSDALRQINADKEFLNEKIQGIRAENVSLQEQLKAPTTTELDEAEIQKIAREETGGERTQAKRLFKERIAPRGAPTRATVLTGVPLNTALRSAKARIDRGEDENDVISEVILSDNRFTLVSSDIIRILRKSKTTDDFFTQITNLIGAIQGGGGVNITVPREPVVEGADVLTESERAEKERLKMGRLPTLPR